MYKLINILNLFNQEEKKKILLIFFIIITFIFLEAISFASVIPVFKTIFLDEIPSEIDQIFTYFLNFFNIKPFGSDYSLGNSNFKKFLIVFFFVLIFLIKTLILVYFSYYLAKFFAKFSINISNKIFTNCLNQDYNFFINNTSQDFLRKVTTDVNGVKVYVISIINLFIEILFILSISLLLFIVNYQIFLFNLVIFLSVFTFYFYLVKKKIFVWSLLFQQNSGLLQNLVFDGIKGIRDIICYGLQKKYLKEFSKNVDNIYYPQLKIDFLNTIQRYWMELVAVLAMSLPLIFFIYLKKDVKELIPVFGLYGIATFRLVPSFNRLVMYIQNINFFRPSFNTVQDVLKNSLVHDDNIETAQINFEKYIEFKEVDFSFGKNQNKLFRNLNLRVNKGDRIAIVGSNGSGKTTFLNLITGLVKESAGSISIDGNYKVYENRSLWNNNIAYVQQNVFLLNTSIKNNIIINEKNLNNERFEKIISSLNLNNFFTNLPNGINTQVGSDGALLSGGQKQIISIARALYKDSNIIIFDEPSSALDHDKSEELSKIIKILNINKTILLVTHDLNSFQGCFNKIFSIKNGIIYTENV
jgi:ABC-type bacteriocin/lantibiotic exporter with double-glycine peptidase domain